VQHRLPAPAFDEDLDPAARLAVSRNALVEGRDHLLLPSGIGVELEALRRERDREHRVAVTALGHLLDLTASDVEHAPAMLRV